MQAQAPPYPLLLLHTTRTPVKSRNLSSGMPPLDHGLVHAAIRVLHTAAHYVLLIHRRRMASPAPPRHPRPMQLPTQPAGTHGALALRYSGMVPDM